MGFHYILNPPRTSGSALFAMTKSAEKEIYFGEIFNLWVVTEQTRNPKTGTLENSKDPDEMLHNTTFHQGLNCLLRKDQSSEKEI